MDAYDSSLGDFMFHPRQIPSLACCRTMRFSDFSLAFALYPEQLVTSRLEGAGFDLSSPFESDYDIDKRRYVYLQQFNLTVGAE